jgi:hypothetical protein
MNKNVCRTRCVFISRPKKQKGKKALSVFMDDRFLYAKRNNYMENNKKIANQGSAPIGLVGACFTVIVFLVLAGGFYLYQVNDLATKGYDIRKLETEIQDLKKQSQQFKIKEVELQSMENIERSRESLNLVSSSEFSYAQIEGPVAMR